MTKANDLKGRGLKVTAPRLRILSLFEKSDTHHLSAEDVYRQLMQGGEDVGLATVYRVLMQFEQAGILERHYFEGGKAVFELKPEGHHDHLVCMNCDKVLEFYDEQIERRQRAVAQEWGFTLHSHSLYLYGHCAECALSAPF